MKKYFINSELCSKYRNVLYGIATIAILVVHATRYINGQGLWKIPAKLFVYGGLGVLIFAFLTGMGSYFSLLKNSSKTYYIHRFERVFVPYLIVGGLFYLLKYFIYSFQPLDFFYEISTLSFWLEHKGPWFIAMLVPVYLCMPYHNAWMRKGNETLKTFIICAVLFFISVLLYNFLPNVYHHLSLVLRTLAVLYVGFYFGKKIYHKQMISSLWIILPLFIYAIQAIVSILTHRTDWFMKEPIRNISFAFCGISLTFLLASLFRYFPKILLYIFDCLGKVSLESYLWNTYLINVLALFMLSYPVYNTGNNPLILYILFVCIVGLLMSFITSGFVKYILNKLGLNKK